MKTQAIAQNFAEAFNAQLETLPGVTSATPRVKFLDCAVYVVDMEGGGAGFLVEKMLDDSQYKKWNNNKGGVDGQDQGAAAAQLAALEAKLERNPNLDVVANVIEEGDEVGVGRIVAMYYRLSTSYQIHTHIRCLYF
jgi:hypothetical protein